MCSCAPASTFNMSSYIGEGRYAVFTSPKSLRPQPVSPERSESWRRGREPAADSTNSHLHLLHHICWRLPLATSRATQRWGQFAPATSLQFYICPQLWGCGRAQAAHHQRPGECARLARVAPPAGSHMRVKHIANLSSLTAPCIFWHLQMRRQASLTRVHLCLRDPLI